MKCEAAVYSHVTFGAALPMKSAPAFLKRMDSLARRIDLQRFASGRLESPALACKFVGTRDVREASHLGLVSPSQRCEARRSCRRHCRSILQQNIVPAAPCHRVHIKC